ncbi:MAG: cell division protein FtsX [Bacteroidetes bacterium]|nr:cell division protein FtsX [Bacteroidota bacterium]
MSKKEEKYNRRRLKTSYVTSLVSITLVLFMMGLFGLIVLHAKKLSDYVKENISISIIMKDDVKEAGIIQLQKTIDASRFVKSTEYITREEAAEELTEELGEDFVEFLGYNPLLPSIDLKLKAEYANQDSIALIEERLLSDKNVKEVFYQRSLVHLINRNIRRIGLVILGFSILLLIITIALINNTIRLLIYSRRFLIKSMQMVGATKWFISRPFIYKGILQGVYSAFIVIILLAAIVYVLQKEIPELVNIQDIDLFASLLAFVIILGIILSWISTYFAVRRYLRVKSDQLYY